MSDQEAPAPEEPSTGHQRKCSTAQAGRHCPPDGLGTPSILVTRRRKASEMSEIDMRTKVATILNDLAKRAPTTAFEQAINAERKRDVPAQCYPKYPPLPET